MKGTAADKGLTIGEIFVVVKLIENHSADGVTHLGIKRPKVKMN